MNLSKRGQNMPASPIRKLVPLAEAAKKKGITVYHLNIGQPDIPTPEKFLNEIIEKHPSIIDYANSQGVAECLEGVKHYYNTIGFPIDNTETMITTGGSEALLFSMAACCDPNDEIISFDPLYTNYNGISLLLDIDFKALQTKAENGYHLPSKEEIESNITRKTKGILICSPNNPTGCVYSESEIRMIGELCKKHNLWLFSDEVYREFAYDGAVPFSVMNLSEIEDRVVVLDSLSKRYSLCGGRIGMIVSRNQDFISAAIRMGQARLCSPTLDQIGAAPLFYLPDSYYKDVADEYQRRRNTLFSWIEKIPGAFCKKPMGAFYTFVTLPIKDADHFASWLLTDFSDNNETVMIAPGAGFYATPGFGSNEIRIAYVLKEANLVRSMEILKIALEKYLSIYN